MNKEEKELIKELERKSNLVATECEIFIERSELFTILNLIDKLQEELKDSINARFELQRRVDKLEQKNKDLEVTCNCSEEDNNCLNYTIRQLQKNSISKDKIRARIKEWEQKAKEDKIQESELSRYEDEIHLLYELLGETKDEE